MLQPLVTEINVAPSSSDILFGIHHVDFSAFTKANKDRALCLEVNRFLVNAGVVLLLVLAILRDRAEIQEVR